MIAAIGHGFSSKHPWLAGLLVLVGLVLLAELTLRIIKPDILRFAHEFRQTYRYHERWYADFIPDAANTVRLRDQQTGYYLNFLLTINKSGFRWYGE